MPQGVEKQGFVSIKHRGETWKVSTVFFPAQKKSKRKILFIHGNAASQFDWGPLVSLLKNKVEIISFDLPGFGKSIAKDFDYSLNSLADFSFSLAQSFGWNSQITVVGHSHGGAISQTLAARYPQAIHEQILLGSIGLRTLPLYRLFNGPFVQHLVHGLSKRIPHTFRLRAVHYGVKKTFAPEDILPGYEAFKLEELQKNPAISKHMIQLSHGRPCDQLKAQVHQITCPTLLIHGEGDMVVPAEQSEEIFHALPAKLTKKEIHLLPGVGHMLHMTQVKKVKNILQAWWKKSA